MDTPDSVKARLEARKAGKRPAKKPKKPPAGPGPKKPCSIEPVAPALGVQGVEGVALEGVQGVIVAPDTATPDTSTAHPASTRNAATHDADFDRLLSITLPRSIFVALTPLQLAYSYEWFRDFSPSKAAARAGYKGARIDATAYRLELNAGIIRAKEAISQALAADRTINRDWVKSKLVDLYNKASAAVPVLDRKGIPTGEYRIDGGTSARVLELLGKEIGMFAQQINVNHGGEVVHLLQQVAGRGKPTLEQRRPRLTLDQEPKP